jgi:hypothetical protein
MLKSDPVERGQALVGGRAFEIDDLHLQRADDSAGVVRVDGVFQLNDSSHSSQSWLGAVMLESDPVEFGHALFGRAGHPVATIAGRCVRVVKIDDPDRPVAATLAIVLGHTGMISPGIAISEGGEGVRSPDDTAPTSQDAGAVVCQARAEGLEPPTLGSEDRCSIH